MYAEDANFCGTLLTHEQSTSEDPKYIHVSHIFKLVRAISDRVKKTWIFYVVTNDSENIFQGHAMFVSGSKMDSRDKMRMSLCCCGSIGSQ